MVKEEMSEALSPLEKGLRRQPLSPVRPYAQSPTKPPEVEVAQRSRLPGLEDSAQSERGDNGSPLFRVSTGPDAVYKRHQAFIELDAVLGASFPGVPRLPALDLLAPRVIATKLGEYLRTLQAHSEAAGGSPALAELVAAF